jgi:preprotein translocase subunit SecG
MRVASDKTKFWIMFAIFFVIYLILYYLVERVHSLEKKVLLC